MNIKNILKSTLFFNSICYCETEIKEERPWKSKVNMENRSFDYLYQNEEKYNKGP
jgi:hypothetical protein